MNLISITDHKKTTIRHVPKHLTEAIRAHGTPTNIIVEAIEEYLYNRGGIPDAPPKRKDRILLFLQENNIITTPTAIKEELISQAAELHKAIRQLRKDGKRIGCVRESKPFLYYYKVSKTEALRRSGKQAIKSTKKNRRAAEKYEDRVWEALVNKRRAVMFRGSLRITPLSPEGIQKGTDRAYINLIEAIPKVKFSDRKELEEAARNKKVLSFLGIQKR